MIRYLADRLWQSLLVLAVMSFVIYGLIGLMPGDPIDLMISADPRLSSEDAARLKEVYSLDRPLLDRYVVWLGSALAGDLGYSRLQARPVLAALAPALGNTARLMTLALMLSVAIALPAGIIAANGYPRPSGGSADSAGARAAPANQPWKSALLRGNSDRFPVLSSA